MDPKINDEETTVTPNIWSKIKSLLNQKRIRLPAIIIMVFIFIPLIFLIVFNYKPKQSSKTSTGLHTFSPSAPYVADQLIVELKDGYTLDELKKLDSEFKKIGIVSQRKVFDSNDPSLRNFYIVDFKKGSDVKKIGEELVNFSEIKAVGVNYITHVQDIDTLYSQQWDLQKINMPQAWTITKGVDNIKVAVIDTGIDYTHPDFSGRTIINGINHASCDAFANSGQCSSPKVTESSIDDNGHGTHVAGTIGAVTNNDLDIAGINWNVTLMAVKAMGSDGSGNISDPADAVRYAVDNGANVINLSIDVNNVKCMDNVANPIRTAINYANLHHVIVVAAAGNADSKTNYKAIDASNSTPASCDGVITVGATDQLDRRPSFSNFGSRVDIAAPGVGIISIVPGGYKPKNGTSMAAPHVAGVAALLLSINPSLTPQQVRECLVNNADPILTDQPIGPRLNASKALNVCSGRVPIIPSVTAAAVPTQIVPTQAVPIPQSQEPLTANEPLGGSNKKPTPTPVKKYTCREQTGSNTPSGAIQIGSLVCIPNL